MAAPVISDSPEHARYIATVDGKSAGVIAYPRPAAGVIDLQHTIVHEDFGGQGVGSALINFALEAARVAGDRVIPTCPFVASYLEKHPEDRDLVE